MCLVLLALRDHPEMPLLLAANRDEQLHRPSRPPALLPPGAPGEAAVFAGQDVQAGGTWLGRNEHGLLAVLTNVRAADTDGGDAPKSRGAVALGALRQRTPEAAADWLERLNPADYRPFHLLFGTVARMYWFASQDGVAVPLEEGCHVLSNSTLDDRSWPKVAQTHLFYAAHRHLPAEQLLARTKDFLAGALPAEVPGAPGTEPAHEFAPQDPRARVFLPSEGYGTVSAALLTAGAPVGDRYYFAERAALLAVHQQTAPRSASGAFARLPSPFPAA